MCEATHIGTQRKKHVEAVFSDHGVLMGLGAKVQKMGGGPGAKSPLTGQRKQLAGLSWMAGLTNRKGHGRDGSLPQNPR